MLIAVVNGSPKGDLSITLQYIRYLQKIFPIHTFDIINVGEQIQLIEKDKAVFSNILESITHCNGILWVCPVYYFLIPSQLKRFIEKIWEEKKDDIFKDKYVASLTTSVHFYDHSAHNYLRAISEDLGMKYVNFFSAHMYDLLNTNSRKKFTYFANDFFEAISCKRFTMRYYDNLINNTTPYISKNKIKIISTRHKKIVIVTDETAKDISLSNMVGSVKNMCKNNCEIINLNNIGFKGGCIGCLHCGFNNECFYEKLDSFNKIFTEKIMNADILIYAGCIKDRFLSSEWKLFFDRCFFMNHIPLLAGKQIGFIVSGPLRQIPDMRQVLDAYGECTQANVVDFVSDEEKEPTITEELLQSLLFRLVKYSDLRYSRPFTSLSIGGRKILRDEIWGRLRPVFQADHKFYKYHGMYDFPQYDLKIRFLNTVMSIFIRIPQWRKAFVSRMREEMVKPHKRVVEAQKPLSLNGEKR